MALDAEIAAAREAYLTNAGYEENESIAECNAFITATRKLLVLPITRTANGARDGNELELNPELLNQMLDQARRWLAAAKAANDSTSVIHADFTDFRQ